MLSPDRPVRPLPQRSLARARRASHHLPESARRGTRLIQRHSWRAALFAGAGLLIGNAASGYRFFRAYDDGSRIVEAERAIHWSATSWPAGAVQEWVLADDPGWTDSWVRPTDGETQPPPFDSHSAAVPFVREAMATWSGIPTADIRWRLSGVAPGPGIEQDGCNAITVNPDLQGAGHARAWFQRADSGHPWEFSECDIQIHPGAAAFLGSDDPRNLSVVIHELGHCLGLAHSGRHPTIVHTFRDIGIWGETPKMSYGTDLTNALALDDIVGASLLRPAGGWLWRAGAITGRVTVSGAPARFAVIGSVRLLAGGQTAPGPGAFTDEHGRFRLKGLVPGDYLIRAGPITRVDANRRLVEAGATLEALDIARLSPVTVRAVQETRGVRLELPPGRAGSDFVR